MTNKKAITMIKHTIWRHKNVVQLQVGSIGCRFKAQGSCLVCNYGSIERNLTQEETEEAVSDLLNRYKDCAHENLELVLGSYGSILDTREVPYENLVIILKMIHEQDIFKSITFETHYTTISRNILQDIRRKLPDKTIAIEMGLESSDPCILQNIYNKFINFDAFEKILELIKSEGFDVGLNVLLGAPGLSVQERIQDSIASIIWAFNHHADWVVLFPMNIKPDTRLWDIYKAGGYKRVSLREADMVMEQLPESLRNRVSLSWYGDRQKSSEASIYGWDKIIPPEDY